MKGGNKYLWYGVAAIAIVVLIAALRQGSVPSDDGTAEESPTPTASVSPTPTPAVRRVPTPTPAGMTYEDAIQQYEGRRFQFDQYCQANPRSMSIKNGTSIMLDNRSGDARTFAVGGVFYAIPGYGWKVVTPSTKTPPATLFLDCGSARNVGTILLQP